MGERGPVTAVRGHSAAGMEFIFMNGHPQDMPLGLGERLGESINILEEFFAGIEPSSNFEALSCDCLRCG